MKKKLLVAIFALVFGALSSIAAEGMYKVEDVYAKKADLKGKIVSVKGEVIKVSSGIMGKDWVHVQDDSKTVGKNKVIFTTGMGTTVAVGDKVTATGVVVTDVDLGAGYFYSVLVEQSTFKK